MSLTYYTQIYPDCKIRVVIRPVKSYATQISRFSNGKVAKNMIKYYGLFLLTILISREKITKIDLKNKNTCSILKLGEYSKIKDIEIEV
mgnify:CR=1 FL=1